MKFKHNIVQRYDEAHHHRPYLYVTAESILLFDHSDIVRNLIQQYNWISAMLV